MNLPLLSTTVIFAIWLIYEIRKSDRKQQKSMDDFWARELKANSTRRKPIDHLDYITIPYDELPLDFPTDDDRVLEYREILQSLQDKKILNLTGYSNTDLKLEYGAPNITILTACDQYYTTLVRTLAFLAEKYLELSYRSEAKALLEYAISIRTDVRKNYELLAALYLEDGESDKINALTATAETLKSLSKDPILRSLAQIKAEHDQIPDEVDP